MKTKTSLLICLGAVGLAFSLPAQVSNAPAIPPKAPPAGARSIVTQAPARPQSGKVVAIDKSASTITVGPAEGNPGGATVASNTVVQVSTNTIFLKNGQRSTLADLTVGDQVQYQVRTTPDGKSSVGLVVVGGRAIRNIPPRFATNVPPVAPPPASPAPKQ